MQTRRALVSLLLILAAGVTTCAHPGKRSQPFPSSEFYRVDPAQISTWSADDDVKFFVHGTMSSEFIPERVLRAFLAAYPDLYPGGDLSAYGVTVRSPEDLPLGLTRRTVAHLGGQPSIGINCAACHLGEVYEAPDRPPIRVLGRPSQFNIYAFFGAIAVSMVRTADPASMEKFLRHYLRVSDPADGAQKLLESELKRQEDAIAAAIAADPFGSKAVPPGALHEIAPDDLAIDTKRLERGMDLVPLVRALLKLFHNIRTALHIPEQLPGPVPTLPGPGRTDAFGVLAASFFGFPTTFEAPVKFGIVWNLSERTWVHWDGNNDQPLARNLGAALGLGTPMVGQGRLVDFAAIERHTTLSERIRAPRYPWAIDRERAARGARHYQARCAACHEAPEDRRLFSVNEVGTDPNRALFFDQVQADLLNKWVAALQVPGYRPPDASFRSTQKYWAADMAGVWARSPYLHNGSVRTMRELLTPPAGRPRAFRTGSRVYDLENMGYRDEGTFTFDTTLPGNSNAGHNYGTDLADGEKRDLIEYLRTR